MTSTTLDLLTGATLACTDIGSGRPVLLLHGVCMSRKFFERNIEPLADRHRVIALDFRGHGESPRVEGGHTVAQYARDVRAVIEMLDLRDAVVVGWSMGSMVLWDYLRQFADDPRLAGAVVVSQGPSDLTQPGWPYGIADLAGLRAWNETGGHGTYLLDCKVVPDVVAEYPGMHQLAHNTDIREKEREP